MKTGKSSPRINKVTSKLQEHRLKTNYSQSLLGEVTGISSRNIYRLEARNAKLEKLKTKEIINLAQMLKRAQGSNSKLTYRSLFENQEIRDDLEKLHNTLKK